MRPDAQRLVDNLPTPRACLRGVGRVHSDYLMSSTLSLGSENIEERAPGGVHDAFCQMMIKEPFESSTQPIREHLDGRSRNMFPTTCEVFVQIVFCRECAILLVLCLECREHLIVDVTRLDQALHEHVSLLLSWIDAVLKRFHPLYFPGSQVNCQVVGVIIQPPLPQTRNAASIKRAKATGFYAAV